MFPWYIAEQFISENVITFAQLINNTIFTMIVNYYVFDICFSDCDISNVH